VVGAVLTLTKGVAVVARLRNTNLPGGSGRGCSGCRIYGGGGARERRGGGWGKGCREGRGPPLRALGRECWWFSESGIAGGSPSSCRPLVLS
jgi:hypothetical protein